MKMIITGMLSILVLVSCSPGGLPAKDKMLKNKSFVHLYYPSEKECLDSQPNPDFFQNCHQQVDFYKNNRVEIMFTDIFYQGTYKLEGDLVIIQLEPNYEIPDGIVIFEIVNSSKLIHSASGTVWKEKSGQSIWD